MTVDFLQYRVQVTSPQEMYVLASRFAKQVAPGAIIGLCGPLGAGKTEFVRGFARAMGIATDISSPTFVLENVYDIPSTAFADPEPRQLHHWDLYRLRTTEFECEIGDYRGDASKITFVEWPERVPWVDDLLDLRILIGFPDSDPAQTNVQGTISIADPGTRSVEFVQYRETALLGNSSISALSGAD